jgi:hypothetical protein
MWSLLSQSIGALAVVSFVLWSLPSNGSIRHNMLRGTDMVIQKGNFVYCVKWFCTQVFHYDELKLYLLLNYADHPGHVVKTMCWHLLLLVIFANMQNHGCYHVAKHQWRIIRLLWKYSVTFRKCCGNFRKVRHVIVKYIYLHWPLPKSLHLEYPPVHGRWNVTLSESQCCPSLDSDYNWIQGLSSLYSIICNKLLHYFHGAFALHTFESVAQLQPLLDQGDHRTHDNLAWEMGYTTHVCPTMFWLVRMVKFHP